MSNTRIPDYQFNKVICILLSVLYASKALWGHQIFRDQLDALEPYFLINSGWGAKPISEAEDRVRSSRST